MIRDAGPRDAQAIADIYNHYINQTLVTFELSPISAATIVQRMAEIQADGLPWIVCEDSEQQIVGYAYADQWRERAAYRHSVESAVYVDQNQRRRGYGKTLYRELLQRLRVNQNVHVVIGVITVPNPASVALHRQLGFSEGAIYREVGRKFDQWIDVQTFQLKLSGD